MPAARSRTHSRRTAALPTRSCSACRAAGCPSLSRSRRRCRCRSTCWWCASLGLPWQPELAMGAIASGGALVLNDAVVRHLGGHSAEFDAVRAREQVELERRERNYRGDRPPLAMRGRTGILVDDGLATGATMEAAVRALQALGRCARDRRGAGGFTRGARPHRGRRGRGRLPRGADVLQRSGPVVRGFRPDRGRRGAGPARACACYARAKK